MKEYQKNQSNNQLKIKEHSELKSVEVDVVTKFIKDEVESFSDVEVYTDDGDSAEAWKFHIRRNNNSQFY